MTEALPPSGPWHALHALTAAACPPPNREWIDALFAEVPAITGGWARLRWVSGAIPVIASSLTAQTKAVVGARQMMAIALTFALAFAFATGGVVGFEGLGVDDDAYLGLASLPGVVAVLFSTIALTRIYRPQGSTTPPVERH